MLHNRDIYLAEVPLEEAWNRFQNAMETAHRWAPLEGESIPLERALGRLTAEPLWARLSSPHYHACAMDGYALRADSTLGASENHPIRLVLEEEAQPVDTGDPLPEWADAVVMVEHVQLEGPHLLLRAPLARWQNIRSVGEDIVATELLLPANHRLRPADLGAAAGAGYAELKVRRRPRVAVLPTGDELIPPGQPPKPGDIVEYNSLVLAAQIEDWGGEALRHPILPDDMETLLAAVRTAAETADLIILNAGSSAGRGDFTARVVQQLGRLLVHGVNIRPGHPVVIGMLESGIPILGLPGYPVSAFLTAELFVRPLLTRWQGLPAYQPITLEAQITRKLLSPAGEDEFVRVVVGKVGERTLAAPLSRGAGVLNSLVRADGVVRIPRFSEGVNIGDTVTVELSRAPHAIDQTLLAIGSHDLALDLMAQFLTEAEPPRRLVSANAGSLGGLLALRRGEAHLAGSHLLDPETGEYNLPYIQRTLPDTPVTVVTLTLREQGLIVPAGNPKGIQGLHDLNRTELTYVNRQKGSGTRILLDYELGKMGLLPTHIRGYDREEVTHLAVAVAIATGRADCGLGVRGAAAALGLDFIPVAWERYDLVIPRHFWESELLAPLHTLLQNPQFRAAVAGVPGYNPAPMGQIVTTF